MNYIDTPYVREFESIAKNAGILAGASYYTWLGNPWYKLSPNTMPLLGLYEASNPLVASKHVDWASGFGINHFYCAYTPGTQDGGIEPYLIGDEIEIRWGERINSNRLKAFDAVTGYTLPPTGNYVDRSPSAVRAEYSRWQSAAHSVGVEIVPSVSPGFDDRYLVQIGYRAKSYGYVPRSIEYFKTNLQIAKEFVDKSKLLKISTWNEWEENTNIEPTVQEGYGYLQTLRDTLAGQ